MAETSSERRWLTLKQAAGILEVHTNTLYGRARAAVKKYATKQTGMPVVRHGRKGHFKFPAEKFKQWAEHPTE